MTVRSTTWTHLWNKDPISYLRYPSLWFVHGSLTHELHVDRLVQQMQGGHSRRLRKVVGISHNCILHIAGSARNSGIGLVYGGVDGVEMSLAIAGHDHELRTI